MLPTGQPVWWLQIFAMTALVLVLERSRSARQAAAIGLLFSTAWLGATFWWLFVAMHTYGGLHPILTVAAIVALAAALGMYYAGAAAVFWQLSKSSPVWTAMVFSAVWTMAEMARGTWLTGFGWGAVGYAHVDGPLAALAPWVGVYGIGAIAAWFSATVVLWPSIRWHQRTMVVAVVGAAALLLTVAPRWSTEAGSTTVTLLQGNIPQDEKFESGSGVPLALHWYGEQLQAAKGSLVVAPETAIALLPQELDPLYWEALKARFSGGSQAALVGIPWGNYTQGYTNTVVGLGPRQTEVWRYDKHHLVPFGEFIPPWFKWFTRMMNIPLGDFNRGDLGQASFAWNGQRLAPNICYEDLFGEELGVRFLDTAVAPTIFVNVSNIGWFGDTTAVDQHLQISRMRALEFERPFVRATNTGATVIMDHQAHITAALPRYTRGVLEGEVQGRQGVTPFAWWVARFGLWPLWLTALAIVVVAWRKML